MMLRDDNGSRGFPIGLDPFTCTRFEMADFAVAAREHRCRVHRHLLRRRAAPRPLDGRSARARDAREQLLARHLVASRPRRERAGEGEEVRRLARLRLRVTSLMRASLGEAPFTIDDVDALASGPATLTLVRHRAGARRRVACRGRALRRRETSPSTASTPVSAPISSSASHARSSRTFRSSWFAAGRSAWGSRFPSRSAAPR